MEHGVAFEAVVFAQADGNSGVEAVGVLAVGEQVDGFQLDHQVLVLEQRLGDAGVPEKLVGVEIGVDEFAAAPLSEVGAEGHLPRRGVGDGQFVGVGQR
mgnify:CR=1 FL=1